MAHVVPPVVNMLANLADAAKSKLSSLQSLTCSGAPLDANMAAKCKSTLEIKSFRQCKNPLLRNFRFFKKFKRETEWFCTVVYGMTETCGAVTWSHADYSNMASVGAPLPGMLFKVVNDKRQLCGPNEIGELCIKGPQVVARYYRNQKATAELLDAQGYVKTGIKLIITIFFKKNLKISPLFQAIRDTLTNKAISSFWIAPKT